MKLKTDKQCVIVFDLDDTLYKEIDFLKSAFKEISNLLLIETKIDVYSELLDLYNEGAYVFDEILDKYKIVGYAKEDLLNIYRNHVPSIRLLQFAEKFILQMKNNCKALGIITDGRCITQRNKITALGIGNYFDDLIISEEFGFCKPSKENYLYFENKYPDSSFTYIADNPKKDFITPNKLNWNTLCLVDSGENIHKQNFSMDKLFLAKHNFKSFQELIIKI